jgi:hypothetical protein
VSEAVVVGTPAVELGGEAELSVSGPAGPAGLDPADEQLLRALAGRAATGGLSLAGEGGFLQQMTKLVLEAGLEAEMTAHLGCEAHAAQGRDGDNSRNGKRTKTVITEVGPVDIEVPRDRASSFAPVTVPKRCRRLRGVDSMVISLVARGMTTGDVQAHLGRGVRHQRVAPADQRHHRRGDGADGRVGEPAPRPGLPGDLHRRDQREDP